MRLQRKAFRILVASVCGLALVGSAPTIARAVEPTDAIEIKTAGNVDEQLFLVRALEHIYRSLPRTDANVQTIQNGLTAARAQATRLRATVSAKGLDARIGRMYGDCLNLIDTYQNYLTATGYINHEINAQRDADNMEVANTVFSDQPGGGLWNGIAEDAQLTAQRNEARRNAMQIALTKLVNELSDARANAAATADVLTTDHHWAAGEAGFERQEAQTWKDMQDRRPRDPFVQLDMAMARGANEKAQDVMDDAHRCLIAARLVPQGEAYRPFEQECLTDAARLATDAMSMQLPTGYSRGPASLAPEDIGICRTLLAFDPADDSGFGHMELGRALAGNGQYQDAIGAWNGIVAQWQNDSNYCLRFAAVLGLTQHFDKVEPWLRAAYQDGFSDVGYILTGDDFAAFRKAMPDTLLRLTNVVCHVQATPGSFIDDVTFTNQSPFPLTHCTVDVTITSLGQSASHTLTIDSIQPGQTLAFHGAFFHNMSSADSCHATVACDQAASD